MNYRHAYHAGNFADCMKHAMLVWLLRALARKPAAFTVLDTHAGSGRYDLAAEASLRTNEAAQGILRLLHDPPPALADYVGLVQAAGLYPGSPVLARALLRPQDQLLCCEFHPEEHAALRAEFAGDRQVAVHWRDGWQALRGLLPPASGARRGLVLIDPPYEAPDEHARVVAAFSEMQARFAQGVVAAWYPIKHRAPVRALHQAVQEAGLRNVVAAELWLRPPVDAARLNGSGVLVVNPPYGFEQDGQDILAALCDRLAPSDAIEDQKPGMQIIRITAE